MSSEGNILTPTKRSSSSSSSESSSHGLFQVDTVKVTNSKDEQNDVSSDSSAISEVDNTFPCPTSSFEVYNLTHDQIGMSLTQRPPVQVMDRSAGYDPYRIPSSVFSRNKSSNPNEWSIASNESLFSLHLGNDSFSDDQAIMFGEVGKSGELTESGELNMFSPRPLVMIEDTDTSRESVETVNSKTSEIYAFKIEERTCEDHEEIKNSHPTMNPSFSHGSISSEQSFAFPIMKRTWPLCYCFNCSWAFCYSWNCSHKRCCYDVSPILTKVDKHNPVKTDFQWQQLEKKSSQETSSSIHTDWCGCFPWCCTSCCKCKCKCKCGHCRHCC